MKVTMRIPTVQYGYIEIEVPENWSRDEIIKYHNEFIAEYEKTRGYMQQLKDDNF